MAAAPDAGRFDPTNHRLPADWPPPLPPPPKSMSRGRRQFLKGPVPWPWLVRAMRLPGQALGVGLMLWRESGCVRSRDVHFCLSRSAADGVPVRTARRAIQSLETAGLIAVSRKPGRGLDVTLLEATETRGDG